MRWRWTALVGRAAVFGAALGSGHSLRMAGMVAVKFPLLLLVTLGVCGLGYHLLALFLAPSLGFRGALELAVGTYRDIAVLLASLAPVVVFVSRTADPATRASLGEYPLVLGMDVVLIAVCGCVALVRRGLGVVTDHGLRRGRAALLLLAWLAVSLFTGAQAAWFLRPFVCPASIEPPLYEGTNPDPQGATSFYEAVWYLVAPPALPEGYYRLEGRRP